jgi:hypothetical protein
MTLTRVMRTTTSCNRTEPLPFTPHLEECCDKLAVFREYESDRLLVQLVAIQRISLKISGVFNETDDYSGSSGVPLSTFIRSMQGELNKFKQSLSLDLQDGGLLAYININIAELILTAPTVSTHYQAAEIRLYDIGLYHAFNAGDDKAHRLSILYSCLLAVKTFFSTHFTLSYPVARARSYMTWLQCGYAIRIGIKLLRIPDSDGWDSDHAREVLDFPGAMDAVIAKLEAITRLRKQNGEQSTSNDVSNADRDIFSQYLKQMRCLKNWSESMQSSNSISTSDGYRQQPAGYQQQDPSLADTNSANSTAQSFPDSLLISTDSDSYLWEALNGQNDDWRVLVD